MDIKGYIEYTCSIPSNENSEEYGYIDWARQEYPEHVKRLAKCIPIVRAAQTLVEVEIVANDSGINIDKLMLISKIKIVDNKVIRL